MSCPSHPPWFDHLNFGEVYKLWSSLQRLLQPPTTSSVLGPNILISTLFSNNLNLCSSLSVRDQISHPYKTYGVIMVLYILICKFLEMKWDNSEQNGSKHFPNLMCSYFLHECNFDLL
jgi:hypothetical protein